MTRFLCAWSPNWPITRHLRANPCAARPDEPFGLVETVRNVRRLHAASAAAAAAGLHPGQTLADARALAPGLVAADADPEADLAALERLADWCVRYSPAVSLDPPDGLLLDATGAAHLWGGEQEMLDDLLDRLARSQVPARGAIAGTAGCAWAVARWGGGRSVIPQGAERAALGPLPVAALRLEPEVAATLRRLGVRTAGQALDLPRDPFVRRFGAEALARLDQALGRVEEARAFRRPPAAWFERVAPSEPVSAPQDVVRLAADVAARICARLERERVGARRFAFRFHRTDGSYETLRVGTALPCRDPVRLLRLLGGRIEAVDPGFGLDAATVEAALTEPVTERSGALPGLKPDGEADVAALAGLVDRLSARLGEDRVWRPRPVDTWIPERAVRRAPPLEPPRPVRGWDADRPRPIRLFERPEPIDVVAPVPDDPPVMFRWRGRLHRVGRAEGPERIAREWWRRPHGETRPDHVRDYYRVEDVQGARFWIFRSGLHAPDRPSRWWLHGLFG
jgi:protein ImuB